jgi:hypothetical protein
MQSLSSLRSRPRSAGRLRRASRNRRTKRNFLPPVLPPDCIGSGGFQRDAVDC